MSPNLAILCGDPAGIGPEIIDAWLVGNPAEASAVTVVGPQEWLNRLTGKPGAVVAVGPGHFRAEPGQPSLEGAKVALAALERSAQGVIAGEFSGVVTGPVSKSWLQKAGYVFPGQTEFFAEKWGGAPTMAFCGGKLRVVLVTWHIPLRDVPRHITRESLVRTISAAEELALVCGPIKTSPLSIAPVTYVPRIGVCGLNPHAGEGGLLGSEEKDFIDPLLDELRRSFPGLSRSEPADTLFARQLRGEFDVIVALYHDQGLGPLKTVDFDEAVNLTLGLPHVRTSPDHGTAFGIAGKGLARITSFSNAVTMAQKLIQLRKDKRSG